MKLREKAAAKLRKEKGFTLTELLVTLGILALVGAMVAGLLPATMRAYRNVTRSAEANILASTLETALADELRYASQVVTAADGTVTWTGRTCGSETTVYPGDGRRVLLYSRLTPAVQSQLVGNMAYSSGLAAEAQVSYTGGVFQVTLRVFSDDAPEELWVELTFSIDPLNA